VSENYTAEHSVHKTHSFEVLSECYKDLEEEENPIKVQSIERNFLKLFGIVL
jgi:hypothetical protein